MVTGIPFRPGDAVGIIASWFVAVVQPVDDHALAPALAEIAEKQDGVFEDLVDVVAGQPVRDLPEFAIGVIDGGRVRALVRGAFAVTVDGVEGSERMDGIGFFTWRELSLPLPIDGALEFGTSLGGPTPYWANAGVVPVSSIVMPVNRPPACPVSGWVSRTVIASELDSPDSLLPPSSGPGLPSIELWSPLSEQVATDWTGDVGTPSVTDEAGGEHEIGPPELVPADPADLGVPDPAALMQRVGDLALDDADAPNWAAVDPVTVDREVTEPACAEPDVLDNDDHEVLGTDVAPVQPESADFTEKGGEADTSASGDVFVDESRNDAPSDETLLPPPEDADLEPATSDVLAVPDPISCGELETPNEIDDPYADVWRTRVGGIEDAAVRPDGISPMPAAGRAPAADSMPNPPLGGDHDGHTRTLSDLLSDVAASQPEGVGVPSSPCVNGHPNPPFAVTCRRCLGHVRDVVEQVPRADAGVLLLPDGERVEVDRTIVVGRNPKAEGLFTGDPPRLVALVDQQDVSRTHVIIEVSGWTATVTDQDSLNGTEVQLPGKQPEHLRAHTPVAIVVGTRIVLANEVVLKLEGG